VEEIGPAPRCRGVVSSDEEVVGLWNRGPRGPLEEEPGPEIDVCVAGCGGVDAQPQEGAEQEPLQD